MKSIVGFVVGMPIIIMILLVGIYLTIRGRFIQFRLLPFSFKIFIRNLKHSGDRKRRSASSYTALCTALAATVGTGNIAGVAGAIALGGPGVVLWMWISAALGMVMKLAEVTLALKFRVKSANNQFLGGPMYTIKYGLAPKYRYLSYLYCIFGVVAAFGVGNATQVNAVIDGIKDIASAFHYQINARLVMLIGIGIAVLVMIAFIGGADGIGRWTVKLMPFASVAYILLSMGVILLRLERIPYVLSAIITSAFSPNALTGGVISSMLVAMRTGVSRGVFTNESGMGTAAIAHASAAVEEPVEQGLMGIVEVFLDTIVICSLTAFAILCSGITIPYGTDPGITLTLAAFSAVYGDWIRILITALVCIFAFATILGWGLYGARCLQFIFGIKSWNVFIVAQMCCILLSVTLKTSVIWHFAEIVNGLMAIPNLICLVLLASTFVAIVNDYTNHKLSAYNS